VRETELLGWSGRRTERREQVNDVRFGVITRRSPNHGIRIRAEWAGGLLSDRWRPWKTRSAGSRHPSGPPVNVPDTSLR